MSLKVEDRQILKVMGMRKRGAQRRGKYIMERFVSLGKVREAESKANGKRNEKGRMPELQEFDMKGENYCKGK